jgi:hypothetical protein
MKCQEVLFATQKHESTSLYTSECVFVVIAVGNGFAVCEVLSRLQRCATSVSETPFDVLQSGNVFADITSSFC